MPSVLGHHHGVYEECHSSCPHGDPAYVIASEGKGHNYEGLYDDVLDNEAHFASQVANEHSKAEAH